MGRSVKGDRSGEAAKLAQGPVPDDGVLVKVQQASGIRSSGGR